MEVISNATDEVQHKKTSIKFVSQESIDSARQRYQPDPNYINNRPRKSAFINRKEVNVVQWRMAADCDYEAIEELISITNYKMDSLFNPPQIDHLIEKSYFPIVQLDDNGKVVSFAAFESYPNIRSVPSFCWNEWLQEKYKLPKMNSRNCLFIHYMVWHPARGRDEFRSMLETLFLEFVNLRYVMLIKPPFAEIPLPHDLEFQENGVQSLQTINVCWRYSVVNFLRIRRALAEDSDDVMSMLKYEDRFETLYGKFFFAELVEFPGTPDRRVVICEHEGNASGVFGINLAVDLDFLNEEFELIPYHGLRKENDGDDILVNDIFVKSIYPESQSHDPLDKLKYKDSDLKNIYSLFELTPVAEFNSAESSGTSDSISDIDYQSFENLSENEADSLSSESFVPLHNLIEKETSKSSGTLGSGQKECGFHCFSTKPVQDILIPRYYGPSNAFAIELFAIDGGKVDERLSIEFLEAAFELAPDRDYCIITIPTSLLPFPLLNHFVKAVHRPSRQIRHELFIYHRSFLSHASAYVKAVEKYDFEDMKYYLRKMYNSDLICDDVEESLRQMTNYQSFALIVTEKIVGVAVICFDGALDYIPFYFDVDDFSVMELHNIENRSILRHMLISPPYYSYSQFFLQEIMRLADVTCLFHTCYEDEKLNGRVAVLGELVPLRPKSMIRGITSEVSEKISSTIINVEKPFALFFTNTQICNRMRLAMNKIIVVVGASVTAFSFFEHILFGSSNIHVRYNNLIWISPHGTGQELPFDEVRDIMFPVKNKYDREYRIMLSLKTHIKFIYGVMTGINRKEKYVIVNHNCTVYYDLLILTVGLQYLMPTPGIIKNVKQCPRNKFASSKFSQFPTTSVSRHDMWFPKVEPVNLFIINTYLDADNALVFLRRVRDQPNSDVFVDKKVIVYGHNLRVFVTMQALLKSGMPGEMIVFVEPFPSHEISVTVFGDTSVDAEVIDSIKRCKIQHYPEFFFYDWTIAAKDRISTITFHSVNSQITLQCLAFMPLDRKLASDVNFNACNDAGLVYDGRLVINRNFRTNDENIYAAGSFTKYSRRYYAPDRSHEYFSSPEIGAKLANIVQREIGPWTVEDDDDEEDKGECMLLPTLKEPLMVYCQLPGDLYYFSLRRPGIQIDSETDFNIGDCGDILVTGDCQMSRGCGYFRIQLDHTGCIQSVTCLSKKEIDYMKLYSLYGLNEKLLNNLLMRYDCCDISDFYEYFRQPWAQALFHPDFSLLLKYNLKKFAEDLKTNDVFISEIVKALENNDWKPLSEAVMLDFERRYMELGVMKEIKKNILDFLNHYGNELGMYATPRVLPET